MSKTHVANIANAATIFFLGLYIFSYSEEGNILDLLPVFFSVMIMVLSQGVHYEQRDQTRITLIVLVFLYPLFIHYLQKEQETINKFFYFIMVSTNSLAMYYLMKQDKKIRLK